MQGNVEYKLRLLRPSPERFARLVTQLKWRLLAGSGQAYYELGVADSGALIGLSRADLEAPEDDVEIVDDLQAGPSKRARTDVAQ